MKFSDVFSFLVPDHKKFFTLISQSSENLVAASKKFNELLHTTAPDKRMQLVKSIADLEHVGDSITHNIFTELSTTYSTPFDRSDIHHLASSLDDIIDYIHGTAKKMQLYKVVDYTEDMMKLAEIIEKSALEIQAAVSCLEGMDNIVMLHTSIIHINSLENQADDIFDAAIASLFLTEKDPIQVIKMKEILDSMETATDKCEDVANAIETIMVKDAN